MTSLRLHRIPAEQQTLALEHQWTVADARRELPAGCHANPGKTWRTVILSMDGKHLALVQPLYKDENYLDRATHRAKIDLDELIKRSGFRDSGTLFLPSYSKVIHSRAGADDLAARRLIYVVAPPQPPGGSFLLSAIEHLQKTIEQRRRDWADFNPFETA